MILVAGLGNPGEKYEATRHNIGFRVVDRLYGDAGAPGWKDKFSGLFCLAELAGARVGLMKPQTFMNRSGQSVAGAAKFYKVEPSDVIIVHDELDLPFGTVRLKRGGGEAGHNGLRSVTQELGSRDYTRVRVGVGKPPADFRGSGADYVLRAFSPAERAELGRVIDRAATAVSVVLGRGLDAAMNQIHCKD